MPIDRVPYIKHESASTGGTEEDQRPTPANRNEDAPDARGVYLQNDTSNDAAVLITRDASNNIAFTDPVSGTKTLAQILAAGSKWTQSGADIYYNSAGNVGIGAAPVAGNRLDVSGVVRATRFISTQAIGTAPFSVTSTTVVTNLNADMLDGLHTTDFARVKSMYGGYTFESNIDVNTLTTTLEPKFLSTTGRTNAPTGENGNAHVIGLGGGDVSARGIQMFWGLDGWWRTRSNDIWRKMLDDNNSVPMSELLGTGSFVVSGCTIAASATLSQTTTAGVVFHAGRRISVPATVKIYTASRDTYVDLNPDGTYTYVEVANLAAAPAVTAGAYRLWMVRTSATAITPAPTGAGFTNTPSFSVRNFTFPQNINLQGGATVSNGQSIVGVSLTTQATNANGVNLALTISKNDALTKNFRAFNHQLTLSTNSANTTTTVDVLNVDTTNTNVTGITGVNLMRLGYGGADRVKIDSNGLLTFSTAAGGIKFFDGTTLFTAPSEGGSNTFTGDVTITGPTVTDALAEGWHGLLVQTPIQRTSGTTARTYSVLRAFASLNNTGTTANATVNLLEVDTMNVSVVGTTVNLAKFSYNGAEKASISSFGNGSFNSITTASSILAGNGIFTGPGLHLYNSEANGVSAVGAIINTANVFTTTGAKLLSLRNAGVEKSYVDKDGVGYFQAGIRFNDNSVLTTANGLGNGGTGGWTINEGGWVTSGCVSTWNWDGYTMSYDITPGTVQFNDGSTYNYPGESGSWINYDGFNQTEYHGMFSGGSVADTGYTVTFGDAPGPGFIPMLRIDWDGTTARAYDVAPRLPTLKSSGSRTVVSYASSTFASNDPTTWPVQYRKDPAGNVALSGTIRVAVAISSTVSPSLIFTLPLGYCPVRSLFIPVWAQGNLYTIIMVGTDGGVRLAAGKGGGVGAWAVNEVFRLDGITFPAL